MSPVDLVASGTTPGPADASALVDAAADAYLDLDLDGVQLIEASAGTGKTFTVATLVTRLVVERGLRLGQILAVTFTEAATQELRARLRRRLALAAGMVEPIAADVASGHGAEGGGVDDTSAEAALTARIIRRQLQHEDAAALHARLHRAAHEIDLAAVFTIHGFCARVLAEHALQTGQAFDPPGQIGSDREWHDEIAADLWRAHGADPGEAESLQRLWTGPEPLARDLAALLRATRVLPAAPCATPDPAPALQAAQTALQAAWDAHAGQARADLDAAIAAKHIDGRKARAASYAQAWAALERGLATATLSPADAHLDKLTPERLRACAKAGCEARIPSSPLFVALADWFAADRLRARWLDEQSLTLLHRIRDDARRRLAELKRARRVQGYDDLIDGVADALDGPQGDALARALRAQYAIALVDEFQDTDARQWAIFRRVFGNRRGDGDDTHAIDAAATTGAPLDVAADAPRLFLIGDPKQAIYGFRGGDVHTYLAAARVAAEAPPLSHNFRSRPGVLRAIAALYGQAGADAFVDPRIRFRAVDAGGGRSDADYRHDAAPAPALTVRVLPAGADGKALSADDSRAHAAAACVAAIHGVLVDARAGRATIDGRAVAPGDIAVLVRSHAEATRMQLALSAAGIPAVAAGKQSLFATEQAGELLALFAALLQPADEGRLRAALATVLVGIDADGIARLDTDDGWHRTQQLHALSWRERWQRHGPLALVSDLCAAQAERLLALVDGERRLSNLMQLAELLQEAAGRALGLQGLVDWLRRHIAEADPGDEQQLLRLESDVRRVQILTLHKSKGLEFPLVFLPFAGIGRRPETPTRHCEVSTADGRVLHWKVADDDTADGADAGASSSARRWETAVATWQEEQRAEDARLLYVGLTRAQHSLWLACGPLYQGGETALAPMLADLETLRTHADIVVDAGPLANAPVPLRPESAGAVPAARTGSRRLASDWWVYSFTQLGRADAGHDPAAPGDPQRATAAAAVANERGAEDEAASLESITPGNAGDAAHDPRFSGSRFGNVLHDALEHVDFAAWSGWRGDAAPAGQEAPLRAALRAGGYADADLDDGVAALTALVGNTLCVCLPEGGRLCDLPPDARRAEIEFHFAMQPTAVDALIAILHAHDVLRARQGFGARRVLEGLMTGKIDLTYNRDGRFYLLDYKSNRLPGYAAADLDAAMAHGEYDLQALIYTLALHRWLRFRLGGDYDYARDFGGVRYLFCRGLDAIDADADAAARGIRAFKPPLELVDALDGLFGGGIA